MRLRYRCDCGTPFIYSGSLLTGGGQFWRVAICCKIVYKLSAQGLADFSEVSASFPWLAISWGLSWPSLPVINGIGSIFTVKIELSTQEISAQTWTILWGLTKRVPLQNDIWDNVRSPGVHETINHDTPWIVYWWQYIGHSMIDYIGGNERIQD